MKSYLGTVALIQKMKLRFPSMVLTMIFFMSKYEEPLCGIPTWHVKAKVNISVKDETSTHLKLFSQFFRSLFGRAKTMVHMKNCTQFYNKR